MSTGLIRRNRPKVRTVEESVAPSSHTPSPISVRFTWHGHSSSILAELNKYRAHQTLSDITLVVEDKRLHAHKAVLAAGSVYFHAMFTSSYSEINQSSIQIHGITSQAMEAVLNYIYTSEITLTTTNVQEIFAAASMLQIAPVLNACSDFMRRHLGVSNCLGIRSFADMHSCQDLKQTADDFTKKNFSDVILSEEFLKLGLEQVLELFSADDLGVASEEVVFEGVVNWIKYDPASREGHLIDLLKKVRLPVLSPAYLCDKVRKSTLIERSTSALSLVMVAMESHLLPDRRSGLSPEQTQARTSHIKSQAILVVGGMGRREFTGTPSIEMYSPSRNWRVLSQMASGSWGAGLVATETNEEVFLVGGSNESSRLSSLARYSVAADQWTSLADMSVARNGVGVVYHEGLLYAIGGFDGVAPLASAECYNPHTNQWASLPDMTSKRFGVGACVCEGKIYAVGGSDGTNLSSAECFDITTRSWSLISSMSVARKFPGVQTLNKCVYAIGGSDLNPSRRNLSVEKYIPSINQWISVASMNVPRSGVCTVAMDGFMYAIGGSDGKSPLSSVEKYDPLTNEWTNQPAMTLARDCASAVVVRVDINQPRVASPAVPENGTVSPVVVVT